MVFLIDKPYSITEDRVSNLATIFNYTIYGGTPLSTLGGVEGLAWVKTKYADPNDDWPDVQFHFPPASVVSDGGSTIRYGHG